MDCFVKDMGTMPARVFPKQNLLRYTQNTQTITTDDTEWFNINFVQKGINEVQSDAIGLESCRMEREMNLAITTLQ